MLYDSGMCRRTTEIIELVLRVKPRQRSMIDVTAGAYERSLCTTIIAPCYYSSRTPQPLVAFMV